MKHFILYSLMLLGLLCHSQTIEERIDKAKIYIDKGFRISNAYNDLEKILEEQPNNLEALRLMGAVYSKMGRYEEAVESINKAIAINDTVVGLYWERSKVYATKALNGKDIEESTNLAFDDTDTMLGLGAVSKKIFELRIKIKTMAADHFSNRYTHFSPKTSSDWKDDKPDGSKELFRKKAIAAYEQTIVDAKRIIDLEPKNEPALNIINYTPKSIASLEN